MKKYDYGEACPVSMAASVICERWTLQVIRELFLGSTRFSEIQKYLPNISPSLLRNRLRFLEEQGILMRRKSPSGNRWEYHLTPSGKAMGPILTEMGKWGMRFASDGMTEKQNTVHGLIRDFAGVIDIEYLPSCDTLIEFRFPDLPDEPPRYIHVQNSACQVCDQDMGFEVDVVITSSLSDMTRIWYGEMDMHQAIESGRMKVAAAPVYLKHISRWLRISRFASGDAEFVSR